MSSSVIFSCVMDQGPVFAHKAFVWASTLLAHAGQRPESLVVHAVGACPPRYRQYFDALGIDVRLVAPFDLRHPCSNKLTQLVSEPLQAADSVVLCDCDLAFCEDISACITGDAVRAKVVDLANLSLHQWRALFALADLQVPALTARATFDNGDTLPTYCNGGLLILPGPLFRTLAHTWPKWNRWLLDRPEALAPFEAYTDQVSFALSLAELGQTVLHLGVEYNFPTHLPYASPDILDIHPKAIHYHQRLDARGWLLPTGIEGVDQQIDRINRLIENTRRPACDFLSVLTPGD